MAKTNRNKGAGSVFKRGKYYYLQYMIICYKSTSFSAKELTIMPGKTVIVKDNDAGIRHNGSMVC